MDNEILIMHGYSITVEHGYSITVEHVEHGYSITMDTILQWILYHSGYSITVDTLLQWILYYSGYSITMDTLLQWILYYSWFQTMLRKRIHCKYQKQNPKQHKLSMHLMLFGILFLTFTMYPSFAEHRLEPTVAEYPL